MRGVILPLPQYAFMAWCSVKKNTGTNLPLPNRFTPEIFTPRDFCCKVLLSWDGNAFLGNKYIYVGIRTSLKLIETPS
jgi:hypothetical protein